MIDSCQTLKFIQEAKMTCKNEKIDEQNLF